MRAIGLDGLFGGKGGRPGGTQRTTPHTYDRPWITARRCVRQYSVSPGTLPGGPVLKPGKRAWEQ